MCDTFKKPFYFKHAMAETICISKEKYLQLKKKAELADDMVLQLEASLRDIEAGRIKRVR